MLCFFLLMALSQSASAQSQILWNPAGPPGDPDRILALVADPRNDSVLYLAAPGGVWKTQDHGASWVSQLDSARSAQVCSLALDPRSSDVLYLGTGDDQLPRPGQGVGRSTDGGQSWTFQARFTNRPVCALGIDPIDSGRVFAGSAEGLFVSTDSGATWNKVLGSPVTSIAFDGRGSVYAGMSGEYPAGARENILARSSDGGRTWSNVIIPANPDVTFRAQANWVSLVVGGDALSLVVSYQPPTSDRSQLDFYRSTDAGNTWSATFGIGQARPPVRLLADPAGGRLYVAGATLLTSANQGVSWQTIPTLTRDFHTLAFTGGALLVGGEKGLGSVSLAQGVQPPAIAQLLLGRFLGVSVDSANGIWGAGPAGLFGPFPALARVEQDDSAVVLTGAWSADTNSAKSGGSAVRATDPGARATFSFNGAGANWIGFQDSASGIANVYVDGVLQAQIDTHKPQQVAQVQLYSVTGLMPGAHTLVVEAAGLKNSLSSGTAVWVDAFEFTSAGVSGIDAAGKVVAATGSSSNIFAAGNKFIYNSTDSGAHFSSLNVLGGELRAPFPPLVVDPGIPSSAFVAGSRLYRTTDSGATWTALPVVDPDPNRVVIALAMAPASRAALYAATACLPEVALVDCPAVSVVWRSANAGQTWVQMGSLPGLVNRLAVDPRLNNTIYAAIGAFPAGPSTSAGFIPGDVLQSMNGGGIWLSLRGNLPQVPVNTIVIDPTSLPPQLNMPAQRLYVGTDAGVFVTSNAGGQWMDISHGIFTCVVVLFCSNSDRGLPPVPITDLLLRQPDGTLLAATYGRGIYRASTMGFSPSVIVNPLSSDLTLRGGTAVTTGVSLSNVSTTTALDWQLNALDPWITVPGPNGNLRPAGFAQVAIRISAVGLQAGSYLGRLQLVSGPLVQNISIHAHVTASTAQMKIVGGNNASGAPGAALPPLQIVISDANQLPLHDVPVSFAITSGGGSLSARTVITNAAGAASTILTLPPTPGTVNVVATSGEFSVTFTVTATVAPALLADSVMNAVTLNGYTPLGAGSVLSIFGRNLAAEAVAAGSGSLPTSLQDTRVVLATAAGDMALPLLSVSPQQIRALLPADISPGIYMLRVETGSVRSNDIQISIAAFGPGIFTRNDSGRGPGIFIKDDGSQVTAANPADRGSRVTFYAAGLGAVNPPVAVGQPGAAAEPLNRTVQSPRVFFDTYSAEVIYSGLAPGIAGRYQVTVRVPALVSPATNISVSLTIGGFASNRVTIPVR
ncbi:MAG TPA: hypothetical protein VE422_41815 [Terriglobia bacterium]|nr:hypothetical protein [Terriglobia bacterium]